MLWTSWHIGTRQDRPLRSFVPSLPNPHSGDDPPRASLLGSLVLQRKRRTNVVQNPPSKDIAITWTMAGETVSTRPSPAPMGAAIQMARWTRPRSTRSGRPSEVWIARIRMAATQTPGIAPSSAHAARVLQPTPRSSGDMSWIAQMASPSAPTEKMIRIAPPTRFGNAVFDSGLGGTFIGAALFLRRRRVGGIAKRIRGDSPWKMCALQTPRLGPGSPPSMWRSSQASRWCASFPGPSMWSWPTSTP